MSLISDIVSGIVSPLTTAVSAIFTKKEDVKLEMYKVNGQVDLALVEAHVQIIKSQAELLKNKWIVALQCGFGIPLMLYYGKCVFWDKVLGLGSTDPLRGDIAQYSLWIVGFLFLHSAITTWTRKT